MPHLAFSQSADIIHPGTAGGWGGNLSAGVGPPDSQSAPSCVTSMRAFALFSLAGLWVQLLLHFHLCPALPFGFDGIPLDMTFLPLWFLTPRAISVIPHPYLVTTPEMPHLATDLIPYPPEQGVVLRAWKFIRGETTFTWSLVSIIMSGTEKYSVNIY